MSNQADDIAATEAAYAWWEKMTTEGHVNLRDGAYRAGHKERFPGSRYYAEVTLERLLSELGYDSDTELTDSVYDQLFTLFCKKLDKHYEQEALNEY